MRAELNLCWLVLWPFVSLRGVLDEFDCLTTGSVDYSRNAHGKRENMLGSRVLSPPQIQGGGISGGQKRVAANDGKIITPVTGPITVRQKEALVDTSVDFRTDKVAIGRRQMVDALGFAEGRTGGVCGENVGSVG